jgi:hypothetical protein
MAADDDVLSREAGVRSGRHESGVLGEPSDDGGGGAEQSEGPDEAAGADLKGSRFFRQGFLLLWRPRAARAAAPFPRWAREQHARPSLTPDRGVPVSQIRRSVPQATWCDTPEHLLSSSRTLTGRRTCNSR